MKKLFYLFVAATLFVGVISCKQNEEATEEATEEVATEEATTEEVVATDSAAVEAAPADSVAK
jgi:hypothetical protein